MTMTKVAGWTITILFLFFLFWFTGLMFKVGIGIVGGIFSIIGGIISLIFSKTGITLIAICLLVYVLRQRAKEKESRYRNNYL